LVFCVHPYRWACIGAGPSSRKREKGRKLVKEWGADWIEDISGPRGRNKQIRQKREDESCERGRRKRWTQVVLLRSQVVGLL